MVRGMHEAVGLPSLDLPRVLQDGGLEFRTFFCPRIANGMKLNHVARRRGEELPELQGSCLTAVLWLSLKLNAFSIP